VKSVKTVFLCGEDCFAVAPLISAGAVPVFARDADAAVSLLAGGDCAAVIAGGDSPAGVRAIQTLAQKGLLLSAAAFGAVTEPRDYPGQAILFFDAGADECFFAGQDSREIAARFKAVVRRMFFHAQDEELNFDGLEVNLTRRTVKVANKPVVLTVKEFELLFELLKNPGRVIDRHGLLRAVWGADYFGSPRTVDVHVSRLRSKLSGFGRYLRTVPCLGYKFERRPE